MHLDHVIAVNVMPMPDEFDSCKDVGLAVTDKPSYRLFTRLFNTFWNKVNLLAPGNVLDTFRRALLAAQLRLITKEEAAADVVIHPRFVASTWHDFENFGQYLQAGREAAEEALPAIWELLQRPPNLNQEPLSHETSPSYSRMGFFAA